MRTRLVIAGLALTSVAALAGLVVGVGGSAKPQALAPDELDDRPQMATEHIVARASGSLDVFADPKAPAPALNLPAATAHGSPRALLVLDRQSDWLEVSLPVRPNGTRGWIRSRDVELRTITTSVVVDIRRRVLTAYESGRIVLESPVAVGTPQNPTPAGEFFVTDLMVVPNSNGPYGPFAVGLSAYSDTLTEFAGGDGQVGIHGTNDPGSIGNAVSHGCVRLPNEVVEALFELVSLGTPVLLR